MSLQDEARALREDTASGAAALTEQAVRILVDRLRGAGGAWRTRAKQTVQVLARARPGMPAIAAGLVSFLETLHNQVERRHGTDADLDAAWQTWHGRRLDGDLRRADAAEAITGIRDVVGTWSASGTVAELLSDLRPRRVFCALSEPEGEGTAMAARLKEAGVDSRALPDAVFLEDAASYDVVLVGADTVLRDGTVWNKRGTDAVAEVCRMHQVPLWCVVDLDKLHPFLQMVDLDPETGNDGLPRFVATPADRFTGYVTEEGVLDRDAWRSRGVAAQEAWRRWGLGGPRKA